VRDDVLERDLPQRVHLGHAVQRDQQQLVQVPAIQQVRVLQHRVRDHRVHLPPARAPPS